MYKSEDGDRLHQREASAAMLRHTSLEGIGSSPLLLLGFVSSSLLLLFCFVSSLRLCCPLAPATAPACVLALDSGGSIAPGGFPVLARGKLEHRSSGSGSGSMFDAARALSAPPRPSAPPCPGGPRYMSSFPTKVHAAMSLPISSREGVRDPAANGAVARDKGRGAHGVQAHRSFFCCCSFMMVISFVKNELQSTSSHIAATSFGVVSARPCSADRFIPSMCLSNTPRSTCFAGTSAQLCAPSFFR